MIQLSIETTFTACYSAKKKQHSTNDIYCSLTNYTKKIVTKNSISMSILRYLEDTID